MWDAWVIGGLLCLGAGVAMAVRYRRLLPTLSPTGPDPFPSMAEVQAAYGRRARGSLVSVAVAIGVSIYLWVRVAQSQSLPLEDKYWGPLLAVMLASAIGNAVGLYDFSRRSERLIAANPVFADCRTRRIIYALAAAMYALPAILIAVGYSIDQRWGGPVGLYVGIVAYVVCARLSLKLSLKQQMPIDPASEEGAAIVAAMESFGIVPKRMSLVPSFMANAFALKKDTVAITTMLVHITTPRELAGILIHELSHLVDNDPARLKRVRLLSAFPLGALLGTFGVLIGLGMAGGPYVPLALMTSSVALLRPSMMILGRFSRKLEFKCDAAAASKGYGMDLATGLGKLHRAMALPLDWSPLDRVTLTHPSLRERLLALGVTDPETFAR